MKMKRMTKHLALLAVLLMTAVQASAESVSFNVCSWDDVNKKVVTKTETKDCTPIEGNHWDWVPLGDKDKETWYVVKGEDVSRKVLVIFGTVHLVLTDHCQLTCNHVKLEPQNNAVLHIHSQSSTSAGRLHVINYDADKNSEYKDAAAIGGGKESNSGSLYVHGGIIVTRQSRYAGTYGAGIGGGKYRGIDANHRVVVYDGELDIEGSRDAAGIGGGYKGIQGGPVYIYGGTVTARCNGYRGAGIGGGYDRNGGEVYIHGGDVKAYGSEYGAAIGGSYQGKGGTLVVTGGKVYAEAGKTGTVESVGPAIGGGNSGEGSHVTIKGGTVTVTKYYTASRKVALIGHGVEDLFNLNGGSLEIASGLKVSYIRNGESSHTLVNTADKRVEALQVKTANIKGVIEPCNHQDVGVTYMLADENQHYLVCKACGYEGKENHTYTDGKCVCGIEEKKEPTTWTITIYKTTDGKSYTKEEQKVVKGKEYMLPVPEPKDGLIFMGYLKAESADDIEMKDDEFTSLLDGGQTVTPTADARYYARYRYDYQSEWTWNDARTTATVKVSNTILNDTQTLNATITENAEKRVEPTAKTPGERYFDATASLTHGTGVTYQFTDNETLVFFSDVNPKITLDVQSKDSANTKTLTEYFGMKADVTMNNLTLKKDKKIHPICLPFYASKNDAPLKGAIIYELAGTQLKNHEFAMTFKKVEGVKPGIPCFYRFGDLGANVQNPEFKNVVIEEFYGSVAEKEYTSTMWSADDETVELWGTFEPASIDDEEMRELYFVMDGDGITTRPENFTAFSGYFYIACPTDEQGNRKVHSVWLGFEEDDAYRFSKWVTYSWDGDGSEATPYIINTAEQLNEMADAFNAGYADVKGKFFKQGANITFDETVKNNFTPIHIFNGNYNGDGHVISGVNINRTGTDNAALFLELAEGSRVHNVIIKNSLFKGSMAAAICCELNSRANIWNCHVLKDVIITANDSCAGTFAARMIMDMGNISKCTSQATVGAPNSYAGGIAGIVDNGVIGSCIYIGNAVHSKPGNNSYAIGMLDMYKDGMFNDHCYYTDASFTHERDIEGARSTLMPHVTKDNTTFLNLLHERDEYLLQAGLKEEDICYDLTINGREYKATQQTNGTWKSVAYTLSLPFDMDLAKLENADDIKVYKLHEVDVDNKVFQFTNDFPILKAGEAYVVVVEKGSLTFTGKDVLVKEVPLEPQIVKNADASKEMGWWNATFKKLTNEELVENKAYVIQKNGTFELFEKLYASRPYVNPFRAYFSALEPIGSVYQMKFIRTENGEEVGDVTDFPADEFYSDSDIDDATGISLTPAPSPTGEGRSGAWHDLQGRQLSGKPSAPGVYVKDGQKIIVK